MKGKMVIKAHCRIGDQWIGSKLLNAVYFGSDVDRAAVAVAIFFQAIFIFIDFDLEFESGSAVGAVVDGFFKSFASFDIGHW